MPVLFCIRKTYSQNIYLFVVKQLLPRADGNLETVLRWRDRAGPHIIVGAIGVISHVEIHKEILTWQRLRLQITACGIRFLASERINEWQEKSILVLVNGQFSGLSIHLKFEPPIPYIGLYAAS